MMRLIATALAVTFFSCMAQAQAQAQAQTAPPGGAREVTTLDQALALAGLSSPNVEAAEAGVTAAEQGRTVAGLRPNPSVSVEVENVAGTGPYRGIGESETTVGFAMPLELGGKRTARLGVANAQLDRARLESAVTIADLRLRVTQAYIVAVAAERRLIVAREQLSIAEEALRVASDRVMVGATSPIDEQRAQVQLVNARTEVERAERTVAVTRSNLERLIGQPIAGDLDQAWFDRTGLVGPTAPIDVEGTLSYAVASADYSIADANVRVARSQRIPDLTLSAGTRRIESSNSQAMVFGVSVPLPLFNRGTASVAQANAERTQADARRRGVRLDVDAAIADATADRDNAAAAVRASGPALDAAIESARIARVGYGQGKFDQLILIDAERTLLETRIAQIDALAAYHDAEARLARLTTPAPSLSGDTQ